MEHTEAPVIHSISAIQMNLANLQVLALDCQATGASPTKGDLLEIGWLKTRAKDAVPSQALHSEAYLVGLPSDVDISPAVQRVTGLSKASLEGARQAAVIWKQMAAAAREIAHFDRLRRCPTIIHYARFEAPFLRQLHSESNPKGRFPLRIICSHEIARRLLPGLPRKGLRAVAGYFGHSVPPLRRAAEHAFATAVIWQHLVRQLHAEHGIGHLDQLLEWLKCTPAQVRTKRVFPMDPEARRNLPDMPGIYRMRRSNGDLLYIGKATSLKQRVSSYFHQKTLKAEHTLEMISQATDLDVTLTGSALEAAVLESDEIKRFAPPYNVALQKGKRRLVFCSRDLHQIAAIPDSAHCIGPLPEGNLTAAMKAFGSWYAKNQASTGDELLDIGTAVLGVPEAYAPPSDCLAAGLDLFRTNHLSQYQKQPPLRVLTALGVTLWRERLAALQQSRLQPLEEETAEQDLETTEEPIWSPEAVARTAAHAIMHSALLIRRARWLCLLSESTLTWEKRGIAGSRVNVLLFENGERSRQQQLCVDEKPPAPSGYKKRLSERQKTFDVTTYERLRVVTTELRRLITAGRQTEVWLKPTAKLNRRHLANLLPWV